MDLLGLLLISSIAQSAPPLELQVERNRWNSGQELQVKVRKTGDEQIFVTACQPVWLELFSPDKSAWIPQVHGSCQETEKAAQLPEDGMVYSVPLNADIFTVGRLVVPYGVDCIDGFPLELAGCRKLDFVASSNISISPGTEEHP